VTWTIVVTNTGNVTLTNVRVTDPVASDCAKTSAQIPALASMAPGASVTYTCSLANVTASLTNVATDIGTPPTGPDVTATDSAHVTVQPLTPPPVKTHPAIKIVKDPKMQTTAVGGTATFKITVTNTGDVTLHDVTVTDPKAPNCDRNLGTMAVDAVKTYTCTWPDRPVGTTTNRANVVGTSPTGVKVRDTDTAEVVAKPFAPPSVPKIKIVKSPKIQKVSATFARKTSLRKYVLVKGGTATFTIKVTNTGNVTLHDVTVTDPRSPGCNRGLGVMARGASKTYKCTQPNVKVPYTNIAAVVGTSPTGTKVRDRDTAAVNVPKPPTYTG
jgi:uncharacterized repeat protein (TIGR01451 family)